MTENLAALKAGPWYRFFANKQPKCPHCGIDYDIDQHEAWHLYDESNSPHEVECHVCRLPYLVRVIATYDFSTDEQGDE